MTNIELGAQSATVKPTEAAVAELSHPGKTPEQLAAERYIVERQLAKAALKKHGILIDPGETRSEIEVAEHYHLI